VLVVARGDPLAEVPLVRTHPVQSATRGLTLGLGTKWGVLRYPWVTVKQALLVSVILVGALVLGPAVEAARDGDTGVGARILAGAIWDIAALLVATSLSVYKPGRRRPGRRRRPGA
jgi:hypothetical protein